MANFDNQQGVQTQAHVANVRPAVKPDTGALKTQTAGLDMFLDLGNQVITNVQKGNVEQDISDYAREVAFVESGGDTNPDNDRSGAIDRTTSRFKTLQTAYDQGGISDQAKKIQAEKIIKENISNTPWLSKEIRGHASSILGYDPSGSEVRALLGMGRQAPKKSAQQLRYEQSSYAVQHMNAVYGTNLTPEEFMAQEDANAYYANGLGISANKVKLNEISTDQYISDGVTSDTTSNQEMLVSALGLAKQGKLNGPEFKSVIDTMFNKKKAQIINTGKAKGLKFTTANISTLNSQYETKKQEYYNIANNQDSLDLMIRDAKTFDASAKLHAQKAVPLYSQRLAAFGPAVTASMMDVERAVSEKGLNEILSRNPALNEIFGAFNGNIPDDTTTRKQFADVVTKVIGEAATGGYIPSLTNDAALSYGYSNANQESANEIIKGLMDQGARMKATSLAVRPGEYRRMDKATKAVVVEDYKVGYPELVSELSGLMASTTDYDVVLDKGLLKAVPTESYVKRLTKSHTKNSYTKPDPYITKPFRDNIAKLNVYLQGSATGWANDFGVNPGTFAEETLSKVVKKSNTEKSNTPQAGSTYTYDPVTGEFTIKE